MDCITFIRYLAKAYYSLAFSLLCFPIQCTNFGKTGPSSSQYYTILIIVILYVHTYIYSQSQLPILTSYKTSNNSKEYQDILKLGYFKHNLKISIFSPQPYFVSIQTSGPLRHCFSVFQSSIGQMEV